MESFLNIAQTSGALELSTSASSFSLFLLLLWVLPWKGYALWNAAKLRHKWWFIALLLINSLAILDIIYIFAVAKKKNAIIEFFKGTAKAARR